MWLFSHLRQNGHWWRCSYTVYEPKNYPHFRTPTSSINVIASQKATKSQLPKMCQLSLKTVMLYGQTGASPRFLCPLLFNRYSKRYFIAIMPNSLVQVRTGIDQTMYTAIILERQNRVVRFDEIRQTIVGNGHSHFGAGKNWETVLGKDLITCRKASQEKRSSWIGRI